LIPIPLAVYAPIPDVYMKFCGMGFTEDLIGDHHPTLKCLPFVEHDLILSGAIRSEFIEIRYKEYYSRENTLLS
jgi:hypothetical protein